jgi:hypothetical protein
MQQLGFSEGKSVIEIGHLLKTFRRDQKIHGKVAHELTDAYPVPTREALVIFFSARVPTPFGPTATSYTLWPPNWIVWLSPTDGRVLRIEEHTPEYYGMAGSRDEPFAEWPLSSVLHTDWTREIVDRKVADLIGSMNVLYAHWFNGKHPDPVAAHTFRATFQELEPQPLMACYKHVAPEFFKWVGI